MPLSDVLDTRPCRNLDPPLFVGAFYVPIIKLKVIKRSPVDGISADLIKAGGPALITICNVHVDKELGRRVDEIGS